MRNWSGETGSAVPPRVSLLISILRLKLTYGSPPEFRDGVHLFISKPLYAIGSVPSLSGHAIAYRWRSLPRVRRHRASEPQGSFERVLPWQVTMDQLMYASLSHTHYWYEVGMWKVPAYQVRACGRTSRSHTGGRSQNFSTFSTVIKHTPYLVAC